MLIGPEEIQFNVHEHAGTGAHCTCRRSHPGDFRLDEHTGGWRLRQELALEAHNLARGSKELAVERLIRPAADPLASLDDGAALRDGLIYAGYEQVVTLHEGNTTTSCASHGTWPRSGPAAC